MPQEPPKCIHGTIKVHVIERTDDDIKIRYGGEFHTVRRDDIWEGEAGRDGKWDAIAPGSERFNLHIHRHAFRGLKSGISEPLVKWPNCGPLDGAVDTLQLSPIAINASLRLPGGEIRKINLLDRDLVESNQTWRYDGIENFDIKLTAGEILTGFPLNLEVVVQAPEGPPYCADILDREYGGPDHIHTFGNGSDAGGTASVVLTMLGFASFNEDMLAVSRIAQGVTVDRIREVIVAIDEAAIDQRLQDYAFARKDIFAKVREVAASLE